MAKTYKNLVSEVLPSIREVFPWDLEEMIEANPDIMLIDIREAIEFDTVRLKNSIHAPRGTLESCCDWDYVETIPELVQARQKTVVVICRSGNRSALATMTMQMMGYEDLYSLKTGLKGWNDSDLELVDGKDNIIDPDEAETFLFPVVATNQLSPN
jgi:rhodanese-related sulfurtransferase